VCSWGSNGKNGTTARSIKALYSIITYWILVRGCRSKLLAA